MTFTKYWVGDFTHCTLAGGGGGERQGRGFRIAVVQKIMTGAALNSQEDGQENSSPFFRLQSPLGE